MATHKFSQQRHLPPSSSHTNSVSMDPNRRKQPSAISTAVTSASASSHPTSTKLDPTVPNTTPLSDSDNLSNSHPHPPSRCQRSPIPNNPHPPSPKVDSLHASLSKLHPKMVGPRTVEKVGKKAKETCHDEPQKLSKDFATEKFNDSEERFERMINCITAKDKEMKQLLQGHELLSRRLSVSLCSRSGRRRSMGGSQIELADVFANNGVKVVSADMPPFMQIHAVDCARKAHDSMEKFTSKSLALSLKKEFDGVYGPAWHCIVGKSFGSFVTHSVGGFVYFSMAQKLYILLFKTTVQRAN